MNDLRGLLEFASEISLGAGKILLRGFRSDKTIISYKEKNNLVTNIDKESEEYLFNNIRKHYPGHAIIAEEGSRTDFQGDFIWYVDPLDGTTNFAHGLPLFCISIGVYSVELEKTVAGVVYDAFHNELFTALRGGGSFLNYSPIHVSDTVDLGISLLATGFPYDKMTSPENNLDKFNRFLPRIRCIRRMGSAAIDLSYVAAGRLDGYWEFKLNPWDIAAGSLLVEEAGGSVSRFDGGLFSPVCREIVASNSKIHAQMIDVLRS